MSKLFKRWWKRHGYDLSLTFVPKYSHSRAYKAGYRAGRKAASK